MKNINNIYIYRMTHVENIPHILEHGITHRNSPNANLNYINIGDISLISTRDNKEICICDKNDQYIKSIILGDFIPFYFGIRMPMLYVVQNGGNFVMHPTPPCDIIYLVCPICEVIKWQSDYYYTDGHAIFEFTKFFDKSRITELPCQIDWQSIEARYWGGNENLLLKCRKQAEFLAKDDIPSCVITNFLCYNEYAKNRLVDMGIDSDKIKIYPKAYY